MLSLTLLVQLFGRETLDTLERAGFDDEATIAGAGAGRLAAECGIALPVAQRIVAVIEETLGPADAPKAKRLQEPVRKKPAPAARASAKAKAAPASSDDTDPFVDDAGLVSWMGFSARTSAGRSPFSVSDGILDHLRRGPIQPADVEEAAPPARVRALPESTPPRTLPGSFWSFGRKAEPVKVAEPEPTAPPDPPSEPPVPPEGPRRRIRYDH